jgi:hypothetical protein
MVRLSKTAAAVLTMLRAIPGGVRLRDTGVVARRRDAQKALGTLWLHGLVRRTSLGFVLTPAGVRAAHDGRYTPEPLGAAS